MNRNFQVYDADGNKQATCFEIEAAAALMGLYGDGATIRHGREVVWTEGTNGMAGDSYDEVADHVYRLLGIADESDAGPAPKLDVSVYHFATLQQRDRYFAKIWDEARTAGMAAGNAAVPAPMVVEEHADPLDDSSPIVRRYPPVMDGVCGFAWVTVHPGNCPFANWARRKCGAKSAYGGGMQVKWVAEFNQSYQRKQAYAGAFAEVLRSYGLRAYAGDRLD